MRLPLGPARARPAEPKIVTLAVGAEVVPVRLRRSAGARRISLRVSEMARQVVLTVPKRAALSTALAFLERHAGWIGERRAAWTAPIALQEGAIFPLRGVAHRVVLAAPVGVPSLRLDGETPVIELPAADANALARRLSAFLKAEARRDLEAATAPHLAALDVQATAFRIGDPKSRWGSCSARGTLSFSWRLVLAPPYVLDYVAAHEVAHLRELNHSPRFWALVAGLYPEFEAAELWLKRHGAGLHRYQLG